MTKVASDQYSEEEADRRFNEAIRRALTTPHKPLSDMVGKVGRNAPKSKPVKKRKKKA